MSRSRFWPFAALAVFVYAALQPNTFVERGLEFALAPARAAGVLAQPFSLVARGDVRAAEHALASRTSALLAESRALLERAGACALPRDTGLATGRGFVHAQAVERSAKNPDVVVIQYAAAAPLQPGCAVAAGDHYLGRVARLARQRAGEAEVELVTAPGFRVGAEATSANGERVALVVGGIALNPADETHGLYLAVHVPDRAGVEHGTVRVRELAALGGADVSSLADGYLLGELVRYEVQGVRVLAVRAAFDFDAGPYELVVLTPPERAEAGPPLARDRFAPERWISARFVAFGAPSAGREARLLSAGTRAGLETGAALCAGGALAGRIEHAGPWTSTAQLVGDPGFEVQALAQLADTEEPLALGRLVALGRERGSDALLFRWENALDPRELRSDAARELGASVPHVRAFLVTGWGERNVPAGLVLGETELPRARGSHVLRVAPAVDARALPGALAWKAALTAVEEEP